MPRLLPLAVLLTLSTPAFARPFAAADYGARTDGTTDCVRPIQAAVDAAVAAGPGNTVVLPPGRLLLASGGVDPAFYVRLPHDAVDLTVTGSSPGTVLLTAAGKGPFLADRCARCTIRNLTVDFARPNVTQGAVTAVGPDTVTVALDAGYPAPDAPSFVATTRYRPRLDLLAPGRPTLDWSRQSHVTAVARAADRWTLTVDRKPRPDDVGRRWFIWGGQQNEWKPFVDVRQCDGLTVRDVDDYAGGGFSGGGASGVIHFDHVYCGPPPGSNRLGFYGGHQGHGRADVVLDHCQWLMSNDDDANELTELHDVAAHPAPDTIRVRHGDDYRPGDTVAIWDYADVNAAHVRDTATVRRVTKTADGTDLTLDHPVTVANPGEHAAGVMPNADPHDRVVNLTSGGAWTLTDCAFSSSFAHPLLLKSARGIHLDRCRIFGSDMSGLDCGMQTYWNEGPQTCDLSVRHCTFYDVDGISCRVGVETPAGASSASRDQRHVVIEDNAFLAGGRRPVWNNIMPRGVGVLVANCRDAVVRRNLFVGLPNANVVVYASADVTVADNLFLDAAAPPRDTNPWARSAKVDARLLVSVTASESVTVRDNLAAGGVDKPTAGVTRVAATTADGNATTFRVTVPTAGTYPVVIAYDNPTRDPAGHGCSATQHLSVNGGPPVTVTYPYTGDWGHDNPAVRTAAWVPLNAGLNTLAFTADQGTAAAVTGVTVPAK